MFTATCSKLCIHGQGLHHLADSALHQGVDVIKHATGLIAQHASYNIPAWVAQHTPLDPHHTLFVPNSLYYMIELEAVSGVMCVGVCETLALCVYSAAYPPLKGTTESVLVLV